MVTHWESSKKPLYVKTIWKEGQHHVILNCKEHSRQYKNPSMTRCTYNKRTVKSAPSTNANLNVSTFKLLENEEPKSSRRCRTGRNVRIKSSVKTVTAELSLNLAVETSMKSVPLVVKSQNVDVEKHIEDFLEQPLVDSLTDRVLMWLDLAIQNGHYPKTINLNPPLEVFATQPVAKKRHIFAKHRFSSLRTGHYEITKYTFKVEGVTQTLQTSDNSRSDFAILEEDIDKIDGREEEEDGLISSRLEENVAPENIVIPEESSKKIGVKRQLHIFLPSLQKNSGFNDLNNQFDCCSSQHIEDSREI
ncbi:uncharacterized protein LOC130892665 [Diorhabda carinulata]|uniref:uncharacterized protein LOC130892665 n=1 Tax=Diorhabda carinulata TaxID=1163345 RepID=UPI0025A22A84|nr:uncharacterized protein LOC130892665 [Diorhabda carinulata]